MCPDCSHHVPCMLCCAVAFLQTAEDAMQPLDVIYTLHVDRVYTTELATEILERGHSRIPVYKDAKNKISVCQRKGHAGQREGKKGEGV